MTVYTSYYRGEIRGEGISISLYPPKNWKSKHLPLFAPTPELLKWWKASAQDTEAKLEYERRFLLILQERQQLIELWVRKQQQVVRQGNNAKAVSSKGRGLEQRGKNKAH